VEARTVSKTCKTCGHRAGSHFRTTGECAFVNDEQDPCRCLRYVERPLYADPVTAPDARDELRSALVREAALEFLASQQTAWEDLDITPLQWAEGLVRWQLKHVTAYAERQARTLRAELARSMQASWALRDRLDQVAAIHVPQHGYCPACDGDRDTEVVGNNPDCPHHVSFCASCCLAWPCPTRRALAADDQPDGAR
jgi:hypothetical protein